MMNDLFNRFGISFDIMLRLNDIIENLCIFFINIKR